MRSFFVQIFLSFWVSTLAIFVAATVIFPRSDYASPENFFAALHSSIDLLAVDRECTSVTAQRLLVLDRNNRDVCGQSVDPRLQQLASHARAAGHWQSARYGAQWALAQSVSGSGGSSIAILLTPLQRSSWFPHLPQLAIPVSALVTFVFAYLLTNPVRALRKAFRSFAGGELTARLTVARSTFRTWGGADIRTLMIDFNEMAERIQALLDAHKILLRDVSHELRSPLARLNVALELAREDGGAPNHALDRAELESSRLNTLIGELLSLSLMETIQEVPQSRNIRLSDLIERLMPDVLFEAEARGCEVIHNRREDCPVSGSEEVLRRALENVIRNAIRHSPKGGNVVIETLTEQSAGDSKALVRICDSGPGVPEESLRAIFRPFYRVDASRQTSTGGFGVGLAIADRAVHIHGGTIQAKNSATGGLCVELRLPCARGFLS